jgi:Ca2+-binding RTX toxin-like protein
MTETVLDSLLRDWRQLLSGWSRTGALSRAAREALRLPGEPEGLRQLVARWSAGDVQELPPVVVLPASAMPAAAAGAYASGTGTIDLNGDWLQSASRQQALVVEQAARLVSVPVAERYLGASASRGEYGNPTAFAALRGNGSVVTWGDPASGGDSRAVADRLSSGVVQVFSNAGAFAALKRDGSVVTWGDPIAGGEPVVYTFNPKSWRYEVLSSVSEHLTSDVTQIASSSGAFAALKSDGSVITWGVESSGGNSTGLSALSSGVIQVISTSSAFAALRSNGSIVTWGNLAGSGTAYYTDEVIAKLAGGVIRIYANDSAFAALKSDGSVVIWGSSNGDSLWPEELQGLLASGVSQIYASQGAFAALKSNGSVVAWGAPSQGSFTNVSNVTSIVSTRLGFAALKSDGSVVAWGENGGGNGNEILAAELSSGVSQICSTYSDFAALRRDGSVFTWGADSAGDSSAVAAQLSSGVTRLFSTPYAFAALKNDGSVVTWGHAPWGGDSSIVAAQLTSGVTQIISNDFSFSALKSDGSVVTWGDSARGGNSSAVASQLVDVVSFANPFSDDRLILDAELPAIALALAPASVAEDGSISLTYSFTRTGSTTNPLTVNYTVGGTATLGTDYSGIEPIGSTKTVTFAAGSATAVVSVDPTADTEIEPNETVTLSLAYGSAYTLGTMEGVPVEGTIINDDPSITLAVAPAAVAEDGNANLIYTFTRSGPLSSPLTVSYTVAGTATLGSDYSGIASAGTKKRLTFQAGSRLARVTVNPTADISNEPDETVALTLASGIDYRIGTTAAVVGRILNDDQPVITLAVSPASVTEDGSANLIYTFSRTGATTSALAVGYTVAGTATLGSDYTGIATAGSNKIIRFAAGSSTATVSVNPTADTTFEPDETVALTLAASSSYRIGTTTAVSGTIQNDDLLSLYNASLPSRPNEQGWLSFGGGLTGSQALTANGTTLTSTALVPDMAGYSNHAAAAPTPVNAGFPSLDRATGFALDFRLRLISETHLSPNRAGFSVTLLDQGSVPQGIELGFWSNSIFSQVGGSSPFLATGERADGLNTTQATTYSLRLLDQLYFLLADNRLLLSGAVQDYSQWSKDPLLPYNPYTTPNLVFLGDNTRSASASVELGSTAIGLARGGGSGADTLTGTAVADSLNGLDGPDQLSGNGGHDWLVGGAGNDVLQGGAGDDLLTGGSGLDRFLFTSGAPFIASQHGVDTITDFNPAEDRIRLARSTFGALPASSTLAATAFAVVNSEAAAASSTARIVYNSINGSLFYNANGATPGFASTAEGGGKVAQLWGGGNGTPFPVLTNTVFEIV